MRPGTKPKQPKQDIKSMFAAATAGGSKKKKSEVSLKAFLVLYYELYILELIKALYHQVLLDRSLMIG